MAKFATAARLVIEGFAASMGIQAQPAPDHSYGFEFSRLGKLSIAPSEDGKRVIMCLARGPHRADAAMQRRILSVAGLDPVIGAMVHAGMAPDGSLVLAIDFEEERFDMQLADTALARLGELHDSVI